MTNDDKWYVVHGEIVGWFASDEDNSDCDIAVVQVTKWRKLDMTSVFGNPSPELPVFVLRWLGSDTFHSESLGGDYPFEIGDAIYFQTCAAEQIQHTTT